MQTKLSEIEIENDTVITSDRYVVMRNGTRVSDVEYSTKSDAKTEYDFWSRIVNRWPDGSKLEIVNLFKKGK